MLSTTLETFPAMLFLLHLCCYHSKRTFEVFACESISFLHQSMDPFHLLYAYSFFAHYMLLMIPSLLRRICEIMLGYGSSSL